MVCTCGFPLGDIYSEYERLVGTGVAPATAMDQLGLVWECCRAHCMTYISFYSEVGLKGE